MVINGSNTFIVERVGREREGSAAKQRAGWRPSYVAFESIIVVPETE